MFGMEAGRAEEIPALAERVGEQRDHVLALDHEQREVVRDRVDERDRDEREHELGRERPRRLDHRAGDRAGGEEGGEHDRDRGDEAEQVEARDEQLAGAGLG